MVVSQLLSAATVSTEVEIRNHLASPKEIYGSALYCLAQLRESQDKHFSVNHSVISVSVADNILIINI